MTLESIQLFLTNVYAYAQLMTAVIGLLAIFIPILKTYPFFYDLFDKLAGMLAAALDRLWRFDLIPFCLTGTIATPCDSQEPAVCVSDIGTAGYPLVAGLVNTGNSCFLNSVLQALSSLPRLHAYLNAFAQQQRQSQPVSRSLLKTIRLLARSLGRRTAFRPVDIVAALTTHHRLVINRDQQDAQEFFQLLAGAIDTECHRMSCFQSGLESLLTRPKPLPSHPSSSPFTGLLASRLSCMQCGYTEAIRHFSFNNIQLMLPNAYTITLDECLSQFTSIEYLQDATCRRCSLTHTQRSLSTEIAKIRASDASKKKKKRRLQTLEGRWRAIERHLQSGRIEDKLELDDGDAEEGERWIRRTVSRLTSKQVMFAKPPKILCLHLSRSAFHASGAVYKNGCRILFPEYLDLSAYTTNGTLSTQPNLPISSAPSSSSSTATNGSDTPRYRLMSTVVHFGSHSYGHYVAFKRRIAVDQCGCAQCHEDAAAASAGCEHWEGTDDTWYRISDTKVDTCSFDYVQQSNPYMLLYELLDEKDTVVSELVVAAEDEQQKEADAMTATAATGDQHEQEEEDEAARIANALLMEDKALRHRHQVSHAAATAAAAAAAAAAATTSAARGWPPEEQKQQQTTPPTLMSF